MEVVISLLDKARERTGSDASTARALGVPQQHVPEWRRGSRTLSPEATALLCGLLGYSGEETRQIVARLICENPKNRTKAVRLEAALFRCAALGVVVAALQIADAQRTVTVAQRVDSLYIVASRMLRKLRDALARAQVAGALSVRGV